MDLPSGRSAAAKVSERLAELLGVRPGELKRREPSDQGADAIFRADGLTFVVSFKRSGSAAPLARSVEQLRRSAARIGKRAIPMVAVPYMGEAGRRLCEDTGTAWLDLSGNARIVAPGVRVHVEGRPNLFRRPGRPSNVFAPKSARIARWLLVHAGRGFSLRELARETSMDPGFTSRIVARLERDGLVARDEGGAVRASEPQRLLEAWREAYDFSKHGIVRGHIAARSSDVLVRELAAELEKRAVEHAATGLGAAWLLSRFAGFRLVTFYVRQPLSEQVLLDLGFREEERGASVWLVVPNDDGVFHGADKHEGVRCVHPVQVYVDLKGHPERAQEAAEQLRDRLLKWRRDA